MSEYTGPNQPTAQGPLYVVSGAAVYYFDGVAGDARPVDTTHGLPVNIVAGGGGGGGGGAVTAAAGSYVDGAIYTLGFQGDNAYTGTGSASSIAIEKGIYNVLKGTLTVSGTVGISGSVAVTGAFYQAIQPVSQSGTWTEANSAAILTAENSTLASPGSSSASATGVQGVTGGKPVAVNQSGSVGTDYSANKPTLPNIGAAFAASGPYANYVLIATVAASSTRSNVDIENTSGAQIAVVRDDGTAAGGSAPANASVFALAGGSGSGSQGGSWTSATFKGRLQIYAVSSAAVVSVMVD